MDLTGVVLAGAAALGAGATALGSRRKMKAAEAGGYAMDDEFSAERVIANSKNPDALKALKSMLMKNMAEEKANDYIVQYGRHN